MESKPQRAEGTGARSLVRKLAEVMGQVEKVPKNGTNNFHNYKYATEADIVAAVRKEMAQRQLLIVPDVVDTKWTQLARGDRLCTLTIQFTVHDGETGEELSFRVLGEGQDPGDKATYKAFTGAEKYALLKLFLIPTGDDPENDSGDRNDNKKKERPEKNARRSEAPQDSAKSSQNAQPSATPPQPAASTVIAFGPHKGRTCGEVSDDALSETIDMAHEKLMEQPKAKWASAMRENLAALESEVEVRVKRQKPTPSETTAAP